MNKLEALALLGQSVWLDYISRNLIESGELQSLIDAGLRGVTSNPTIFEKAISGSRDYDQRIKTLAQKGYSAEEIYTDLTVSDIQHAADLFLPVYEKTSCLDGYISLEVNPTLAHDSESTIEEAIRLWKLVDRPNLMVKIPATLAGLPAIQHTLAMGININVTLIFSTSRYLQVLEVYRQGIEERIRKGLPVSQVASVASFFVSRLDTKVDKLLANMAANSTDNPLINALPGKAAVANSIIAYQEFKRITQTREFIDLVKQGAQLQRPLWASTSTKNPSYSDILYVQELIGRQTVNTMPRETLEAFLNHGEPRISIDGQFDSAHQSIESLANLGISLPSITQELEEEGVSSFVKSFVSLLQSIDEKRRSFIN